MTKSYTFHGSCKLTGDCPASHRVDCYDAVEARVALAVGDLGQAEKALRALQRAVEHYLERPGCNINSKRSAMDRLRWSLDRSRETP